MEEMSEENLPRLKPLPTICHPSTSWQQDNDGITLEIQLQSVKAISLRITSKQLLFWTEHENKRYVLLFDFFDEVAVGKSGHTIFGSYVAVYLEKIKSGQWPRLIASSEKIPYLKRNVAADDLDDDGGQVSFAQIRKDAGMPYSTYHGRGDGLPPEEVSDFEHDATDDDDDLEKLVETDDENSGLDSDEFDG